MIGKYLFLILIYCIQQETTCGTNFCVKRSNKARSTQFRNINEFLQKYEIAREHNMT
jgi:hypothetical protein